MTWDQHSKITSFLVKSSFHLQIYYHLRISPSTLHWATIRLPLLASEKDTPTLKLVSHYAIFHEIHGSI